MKFPTIEAPQVEYPSIAFGSISSYAASWARLARIRSYLTNTAKHDIDNDRAHVALTTGHAWQPPNQLPAIFLVVDGIRKFDLKAHMQELREMLSMSTKVLPQRFARDAYVNLNVILIIDASSTKAAQPLVRSPHDLSHPGSKTLNPDARAAVKCSRCVPKI
jgi:hypothetical protein